MVPMSKLTKAAAVGAALVGGVAAYDVAQRKDAILKNFPVIGHGRYLISKIGPELRQYIVAGNNEERPFTRDQREWIYSSAELRNNYFGFGTDNDLEQGIGYPVFKQATFRGRGAPSAPHAGEEIRLPSAKVLGEARGRRHAFRPGSIINVSGMSYGALSGPAVQALNAGAKAAGCLQNTGEGGLSPHHLQGGDLIFQIGTAYFGCRDERGEFSLDELKKTIASGPVRAIEIKLSQGAKPGLGGVLPGAKVSEEIARIRGIKPGEDSVSSSRHSAFFDVESMLEFVELLGEETGLPIGIKSAVGQARFWEELVAGMRGGERGVDFITIDGGEGGTGAAPLVFTDAVSFPFRVGFAQVYRLFAEAGLTDRVTFIGSGKLGLPENAAVAFALGVDMVNVGREALLSIGCIQAQRCHTDHCPTGITTQNPWLMRGLDPELKSVRFANYIACLRRDLVKLSEAIGVIHPALIGPEHVDLVDAAQSTVPLTEAFGYAEGWGVPNRAQQAELIGLMLNPAH